MSWQGPFDVKQGTAAFRVSSGQGRFHCPRLRGISPSPNLTEPKAPPYIDRGSDRTAHLSRPVPRTPGVWQARRSHARVTAWLAAPWLGQHRYQGMAKRYGMPPPFRTLPSFR